MALDLKYDDNWKPGKEGAEPDLNYDPNWKAPADSGGFVASAKQSVGSLIKGAGQAAADFIPGVSQGNAVQRYGQSVIDANPTAVHSLSDIADKPVAAVKEAAGNAAGSIGGMVGARVLGNAITAAAPLTGPAAPVTAAVGQGVAWLGPWAAAALPSFGGIREQQVKDDPSKQGSISAKALAAAGAGTVGLIERFGPQQWAMSALSQEGRKQLAEKFAAKSLAGSVGKGVAKGAAVEGAEELAQNPIEQLASYQDPTTAENLQDTAFSGVMGALGGGVFGGGMGAASRMVGGEGNKPAPQADPAADQASPTLALPAPPPSTGTPGEQLAASDAERAAQVTQAEARAADIYRQRDEFDAARQANMADAPLPFDPSPAEELAAQRKAAMGIDPAAGPLSAAASIAVESQAAEEVRLGAASVLAEGAARAQQAQAERAAWEAANPGIPYEPVQPARQESRPAPAAQQQPAGSFGAMNDFADLLDQERQDVTQRRASIAERQGQRRAFDLAEADRRTAESMQREAQARRRAVLDAVLADPETKNPAGRFAATLRREGYRDSTPTEDELRTIQRFEDVRAAKPAPPEVEPSAPNELDPAALGIRERRAPAPPKNMREGMARAQAARAAEGGSMPQAAQPTAAPSFDPGKAWASLDTKQRTALAGRLQGVPPIVSKNVHRADWAKINPALQGKLAEAMQPRAAAPIEGADLGDGWTAFRPESGTAGVPRAEMPQIKAEHRGAMVNFMNARGVQHQEETVPAASLKPTQAEFSREKVARAKAFDGGSRSILVSADNHVLDGHHQWMAARDNGEDVKVIRLAAPIRELVGLAHDFPSSTTAGGAATAEGGQDGQSLEQQADAGMASQSRAQGRADVGRGAGDLVQPADGTAGTGVGAAAASAARSGAPAEPAGAAGGGRDAVGRTVTSQSGANQDAPADEALRVQAAIEGKGLLEAARFMTQSADPARAEVAGAVLNKLDRLQAAGVTLGLTIAHRGDMVPAPLHNGRGYTETGFDEKGRDIAVWLNGADVAGKVGTDEETLLHELVHAATTGMVFYGQQNPSTQAGQHVRDLMAVTDAIAAHISQRFADADAGKVALTEFEKDMREGANNAFRNDDEVLAWALSSRDAQTYLEGIPYKAGTLWARFVSTVRNLLGLPAQADTALSEVLRVADRMMTDDAPQAGRAAFWHKRGMQMVQQQGKGSIVQARQSTADARRSAAADQAADGITAESLPGIFAERFPELAGAVRTMLDRGALGQKGGLVVLDSNDEATIAREFADRTGRSFDDTVQLFAGAGEDINAFYDPASGQTFLVGPNLSAETLPAVVLHEMVHGQQRQELDQKALALIEGRTKEAPALRAFLDRVAERMETVGESDNPFEATSYIVEMAVTEGRQAGFSAADGPILAWIERNIGRKVADLVRDFVATVRAWALAHGVELKRIAVDDLVAYAMAGVGKAARGKVVTDGKAGPAPAFSRGAPEGSGVGRVAERLRDTAARAAGRPRPDPSDPFSAENTRLREQDKSLWQKAKGQLRRWLAPGGLLPDSVFAEKIARDSNFQAVEFDVRHIVGGFEQAVKQDFGVSFDKLTQAQQRTLSEALAGKVAGSLPAATKTAAVAMRQYIDSLSGEYLQIIQGKIDALQARAEQSGRDADKVQAINEIELYQKIRSNVGAYVHRSYQAFDDPKWFQKVPTATLNAARQYLKGGYMEGGKTSEAEALRLAEVALAEILKNGTAYDSMESFIAEGKLGAKDLSVLMRRKDVPPVIRALLGEYTDPRLNFTKSATKMGRLIWNQRFLDRVREMGMGTFLFEGKDRPPSATTQIAAQGSEVYAPLNGLWTFPEVAQSFKDALGKEQMGELYRFIVRANGLVKYGKTVLSPTTAMRNWQSAMFFALANGHFDLTQMKKSVAAFREQVRQNATDGDLAYLRHLKELGVVYDTPYAGEMMRFIEDAKADSGVDTVMRAFGASDGAIAKGLRGVKQINQVAQGFYSFGDDFWKIIGFENEKAGLLKAGLPVAEAEREAAKRIRDTYPTYSMVGAGIQKLSRFPLMGTFVSFPAEIVRTSANMLRTTAADLKSDNPALRALGMKRAVGMAMVSGLFYGLAALSKAGSGVDDDEEEALRDLAPEWQKNSTFLFAGRDEKGQLRYFDMSFLDPYGYWKRPITAMLRDQPWEKSAASAIKDMLTPFLGADIATAAIFQVLANKKDSGGKVYQEGADALDQTGAIANHLRKALQPGFVGNIERLTLAAQGMRREGSGQPYDLNDEMTALLGWRASTMDPKTALYYRSFEFNDAMSEAKQVLTRTLRSVNPVSPEDIRDAREVAQSRQAEAFTEMRRLVLATQAAGMNPAQIRQVLKQSSISQANAEALMRGTPPRLVLGVPAAAKAVQQARVMEGPEFAQEVARRYRMASGM